MKKTLSSPVHPMVIFWLGVLTGAIVVGLLFFYRALNPIDYASSSLRYPYTYDLYKYSRSIYDSSKSLNSPSSIGSPTGGATEPYSIGTPTGGIVDPYSIGTPTGG